MDFELSGKRVVVCGASQGIGKACALEFARQGACCLAIARSERRLNELLEELPGRGHSILAIDFADPKALRAAVEGESAHILINNTGGPPHGPIVSAPVENFARAFTQHVLCNQVLMQTFVPRMQEAGYGRIINIVSTSVRQPITGIGVSNTIRAAVAGWAKTLSNELAPHGITVNNVLPGSTDTARLHELIQHQAEALGSSIEEAKAEEISGIPMRRLASSREIALAVCFLASPAASYITGVSLPVDGGKIQSI